MGSAEWEVAKPKIFTFNFVCGSVLHFALMTNYFSLMVIVADYCMHSFDAPTPIATTATGIFVVTALFARLTTDFVLRHFGLRGMLLIAAFLQVACSVLYLVVPDVWLFLALRVVHGFSFGIASTAAAAAVTGFVPAERRGEGIGYFMLSSPLGAAIGPAVAIALARACGYLSVFLFATTMAAVLLGLSFVIRVDRTVPSASINNRDRDFAYGRHEGPAVRPSPKCQMRRFTDWLSSVVEFRALPISVVGCVIYFAYSSLLAFMNSYAVEIGLGESAVWFFTIYAAAMVITRPFTGKAFDRIGERVAFVPAFVLFAIGMLVLWKAQAGWQVFTAAALLGYGLGSVQSCGLAVAVSLVEPERVPVSNSTYFMLLDAGVGFGPMVHGVFVSMFGITVLWPLMAVIALMDLVIYLVVSRRKI